MAALLLFIVGADRHVGRAQQPGDPAPPPGAPGAALLTGWLSVVWVDGPAQKHGAPSPLFFLADDRGRRTQIDFDEPAVQLLGGPLALNGRRLHLSGGARAGAGNRIAFNAREGIVLFDAETVGNTLRGNALYANGALGINLVGGTENGFGVTANDGDDSDTGPNNLQNYPAFTSVVDRHDHTEQPGSGRRRDHQPEQQQHGGRDCAEDGEGGGGQDDSDLYRQDEGGDIQQVGDNQGHALRRRPIRRIDRDALRGHSLHVCLCAYRWNRTGAAAAGLERRAVANRDALWGCDRRARTARSGAVPLSLSPR